MKIKKKYDVVTSGYLCIDMIIEFTKDQRLHGIDDYLKPGKLTEVDGLSFTLGGAVANTGMAVKKFGKTVFMNGLVGNDKLGEIILDQLEPDLASEGIKKTHDTGSAFGLVIAPPGVDRIFLESPGCSRLFSIHDIDFDAITQARILHFGYVPLLYQFFKQEGSQLAELLARAKQSSTITSMDLSLPDPKSTSGQINWLSILQRVFPYTDILIPSLEELLYMMLPEMYERIVQECGEENIIDRIPIETVRQLGRMVLSGGVKILMIKMAHRGGYLVTGDVSPLNRTGMVNLSPAAWNHGEWFYEAYTADEERVTTASGAGDTAAAAFLVALLDNESPERTIKFAAMAGRNGLYCINLYRELPDWSEMRCAIEEQQVDVKGFTQFNN